MRAFLFSFVTGELNDLVGQDIAVLWNRAVFNDTVDRIIFEPGDKIDAALCPLGE